MYIVSSTCKLYIDLSASIIHNEKMKPQKM